MNTLSRRALMGVGGTAPTNVLKFTVNEGSQAGTITLTIPSGLTEQECTNIQYSLNGRTWVTFENHGQGLTITTPTLIAGDSVYFRGQATLISKSYSVYSRFTTSSSTFKISASGSIMSLIGNNETLTNYAFYNLFGDCASLTIAPELPATTLAENCYHLMFEGCSSLTTAPELPATTLAYACYSGMFYHCTSLTKTPSVLPAQTAAIFCYSNMFNGCTSILESPVIQTNCPYSNNYFGGMFYGCTQLVKITLLSTKITHPETTLTDWVSGVAATGTFIKNPAMTTLPTGNNGIPSGWTVEDYAG